MDRNMTTLDAVLGETSDYDLDDIIEQRKLEKEMIEAAGLPFVTGQQVVVNQNPDEMMKEKPKGKPKGNPKAGEEQ